MMTLPQTNSKSEGRRALASCSRSVSVLFARADSIYKEIDGCDVWDMERDATNYDGDNPVIAHPPCRSWSQLRHFAKPRAGEKELAPWAIEQVRRCGGVLEHPAKSALWPELNLPEPGERDEWGGWTFTAPQMWWGHLCNKATRLYIVGCEPDKTPPVPFVLGDATHVQTYSHKCRSRPQMPPSMREKTPPDFARWLVQTALICGATAQPSTP